MLSLHKFRPVSGLTSVAHSPLLCRHAQRPGPRNKRFLLTGLGTEFLDLALGLPIPPSWPAYSTGIILVTLVTRFALLPVSIWGKQKSRIIEEVIVPQLAQEKPAVEKRVFEQMKADKIRGDKPFLIEYHAKKCHEIMKAKRSELFKKHGCQPWKTLAIPPLIQLPPFVAITMVLRQLSESPTPFDSESFLTLSTLAHPDPTMTLPIVLGVITMANVESSNWLMTATQKENMQLIEKKREAARAAGKRVIEPGNIIKTALRGLSVVRILIASMMPGSITLYWVSSATFGLLQTWIMDWMDYRRRLALEASRPAQPASTLSQVQSTSTASISQPAASPASKPRRRTK